MGGILSIHFRLDFLFCRLRTSFIIDKWWADTILVIFFLAGPPKKFDFCKISRNGPSQLLKYYFLPYLQNFAIKTTQLNATVLEVLTAACLWNQPVFVLEVV